MPLSRLNCLLALLLGLVVVMLAFLRIENARPNFQVNLGDDMTYSPAYKPFEANRNFGDGRTMQGPVAGTFARGTQPFRFDSSPEDALRAGDQLPNPFVLGSEERIAARERGQAVYQISCAACHGQDGAGNGPVAQRGFPPPPSLLTGKSREMKDGQLFHILTLGQNNMPPFAAQLPPDRRWAVIAYIRQLQQEAEPATPPKVETDGDTRPVAKSTKQGKSGEKP